MKKLSSLIILFLSTLQAWGGPSVTVGPGSPVARYCVSLGGKVVVVVASNGNESGVCLFKGDAIIGEVTLFRAGRNTPFQAIETFLAPVEKQRGDTKYDYCENSGGQIKEYRSRDGIIAMCIFADGSSIEAGTLLRGPKHTKNKNLLNVLLNQKKEGNL